jgi:hypothetical protein
MTRVGRTDWYSLQANVAPRARIEYLIADGPADYRLDPHNPRQSAGPQRGGLPASEFVTSGYLPPPEFADPPASPAGLITEATVERPILGGSCRLIVYTPPGYRDDGEYPVAVFLDLRSRQVSRVLDWLIAHQAIEPIVAVFVGPASRGNDHFTGAPMRTFLTDELPTWMTSRYGVSRSVGKRAIIGISFGAKDALNAAVSSGGGRQRVRPPRPVDPRPEDRPRRHRCHRPAAQPSPAGGDPGGLVRPGERRDGTQRAAGARRCRPFRGLHRGARGPQRRDVDQPSAGGARQPVRRGWSTIVRRRRRGGTTARTPQSLSWDDSARRRELRDN